MSWFSDLTLLKALVLITLMVVSIDRVELANAEAPKRRPGDPLNVVDAKITSIRNKQGEKIEEIPVGTKFEVQGSFRVPGGVEEGPPPIVVKVRDKNGIVHGSTAMRPNDDGKDGYTFKASIDTVKHTGNFTLEVRVQGQEILTKDVVFVK